MEYIGLLTNGYPVIYNIGSNMFRLKVKSPTWKIFYVVFHKVQFLAISCLNIYLNGICNVSGILKFTLFANDTNIICSCDSTTSLCNTLNTELEKLNAWLLTSTNYHLTSKRQTI